MQSGRVPENVWSDLSALEGRTFFSSRLRVDVYSFFDTETSHGLVSDVDDKEIGRYAFVFSEFEIFGDKFSGFSHNGYYSCFSAFARQRRDRSFSEFQIRNFKIRYFLNPRSRIVKKLYDYFVPESYQGVAVCFIQNGSHFLDGDTWRWRSVVFFGFDGMHAFIHVRHFRLAASDELEERLESRESLIPCRGAVSSVLFNVIEKINNHLEGDVFDFNLLRLRASFTRSPVL